MSEPLHIALFGTSADPPTVGHQQILVALGQQFERVLVWASDNPFKQHGASLEQRTQMLAIVVAAANQAIQSQDGNPKLDPKINPTVKLCPELSDRRTIVTVTKAQTQWPQARFTLVIGSDLVTQLPSWYQAETLIKQVRLLVIPRPHFPIAPAHLEPLQRLGAQVTIAQWQGLPVSSTIFREVGSLEPLTSEVYQFIHLHQLYLCRENMLNRGKAP